MSDAYFLAVGIFKHGIKYISYMEMHYVSGDGHFVLAHLMMTRCCPQERSTYADSAWTHWAINQATSVIRAAAAVHDSHLMSLQPMKSLKVHSLCSRCVPERTGGEGRRGSGQQHRRITGMTEAWDVSCTCVDMR